MGAFNFDIPVSGSLKIRRQSLASVLAGFAFICQFPCFYVYHLLVVDGVTPFLAGYTVRVAALLLPIILFTYVMSYSRIKGGVILDLAFIIFCFYIVILAWVGYYKNSTASKDYMGAAVVWLSYYFNIRTVGFSWRWVKIVYLPAILLILVIVATNTSSGIFELGVNSQFATYQSFAIVLMVVVFLLLASVKSRRSITFLWIASLPLLFVVGARSELAAMIAFGGAYTMFTKGRRISAMFAAFIFFLLVLSDFKSLSEYSDNRVIRILVSGADANITERSFALDYALAAIKGHPFTGDFGQYPDGLFAHNALSAWADFGIVGFIFFILLLGTSLWVAGKRLVAGDRGPYSRAVISATVAVIILLITAKTFVYFLVPVIIAMNVNGFNRPWSSVH